MLRLKRYAFVVCSGLSLLLAVAACGVWVRSHWRGDKLSGVHNAGRCHWAVTSFQGDLFVRVSRNVQLFTSPNPSTALWTATDGGRAREPFEPFTGPPPPASIGSVGTNGAHAVGSKVTLRLGELRAGDGTPTWIEPARGCRAGAACVALLRGERHAWLAVPHWLFVLPLLILPAVYGGTAGRRIYRARAGMCVTCGYDLRGSPGPRCPECGAMQNAGDRSDSASRPQPLRDGSVCALYAVTLRMR